MSLELQKLPPADHALITSSPGALQGFGEDNLARLVVYAASPGEPRSHLPTTTRWMRALHFRKSSLPPNDRCPLIVTIQNARGQGVYENTNAAQMTEVNLPAGVYNVFVTRRDARQHFTLRLSRGKTIRLNLRAEPESR